MGTPARPVTPPRALTIAGSDSGGGAGIQADLKTFFALGCHGMSAITALTAQNTRGVTGIHEVPPEFVIAQIDAVVGDIGVDAAKCGMLSSTEIVEAVAKSVEAHDMTRLVVDPVFVAKGGDRLLREDAVESLKRRLIPLATIITPNLHEASALVGRDIHDLADMRAAAADLLELGCDAVLVKGGHLDGNAIDVYADGSAVEELAGDRYDSEDTHGTGCTLAAAITAHLAHGSALREAVHAGKTFVSGAIRRGLRLGGGHGPVNPGWQLLD